MIAADSHEGGDYEERDGEGRVECGRCSNVRELKSKSLRIGSYVSDVESKAVRPVEHVVHKILPYRPKAA